ncbi:uncharacterized protein YllA (UPF0747 family) [Pseudarthrobacter oxydans]|uniref:Uncharacterized protein YllA (UPF0747 family) n=1 Tax=Pseudarthrobacter oxydans TaxID=1671 RepID=A0AAW8NBE5_PSEOX|nr:hypothetical protein [Pseudarthrobacter oxydans]MDR6794389.1 uncharacterized protein YllA (UPF0747 family) [Pseudarthrobacter oxydans]MDR7164836.1 uncharacterized protein YllA (UPF0747 family) [Pseudarthrobacter oxydans]
MSAMDGMGALAGLAYAMAPEGSKYRKHMDKQAQRAARRAAVTPETREAARVKRINKTIAEKEAWITNCLERGDAVEAERWTGYVADLRASLNGVSA